MLWPSYFAYSITLFKFDWACTRNEYHEYFLGIKGGRCLGLTTLPPSYIDCFQIWEPNLLEPSGPFLAWIRTALSLPYMAEGETKSGLFWNLRFHKIWGVCYLAAEFLRGMLIRVVLNLKPNSARNCYLILYCNVILVISQTRGCITINVGYPKAAPGV